MNYLQDQDQDQDQDLPTSAQETTASSANNARLKDDLEAKLNLTWRSEREHTRTHSDAIGIVRRRIRTVDRTRSASLT